MAIFENIINFGTTPLAERSTHFFREVFWGTNVTWMMSGIQTPVVAWFAKKCEKVAENPVIRFLSVLLFTFFSGIVITVALTYLTGEGSFVPVLKSIPVLGLVFSLIISLVVYGLMLIAFNNVIENIRNLLLMVPVSFFVAWAMGVIVRAITGAKKVTLTFALKASLPLFPSRMKYILITRPPELYEPPSKNKTKPLNTLGDKGLRGYWEIYENG